MTPSRLVQTNSPGNRRSPLGYSVLEYNCFSSIVWNTHQVDSNLASQRHAPESEHKPLLLQVVLA